jgi:anti-sigma regulatory factor (Ser/Thr protein kinase)
MAAVDRSSLALRNPGPAFRHEALLYAGDDEFIDAAGAFIRGGLESGEPTLVVVARRKIDGLRELLSGDATLVHFADMAAVGRNPARIIPAWREFVDAHAASGVRLRGVGEPVSPERSGQALVECQRHEALLNLAFHAGPEFWLLCPYDTSALPASVVAEARRSHPYLVHGGTQSASDAYPGATTLTETFDSPLPAPPAEAVRVDFAGDRLREVRRLVRQVAADAGAEAGRPEDFAVAVSEVATNSVVHGGGAGTLTAWTEGQALVCQVADGGRIVDPLAGRLRPAIGSPRGYGLWIANQLCDLVQIRSAENGTTVRLYFPLR